MSDRFMDGQLYAEVRLRLERMVLAHADDLLDYATNRVFDLINIRTRKEMRLEEIEDLLRGQGVM